MPGPRAGERRRRWPGSAGPFFCYTRSAGRRCPCACGNGHFTETRQCRWGGHLDVKGERGSDRNSDENLHRSGKACGTLAGHRIKPHCQRQLLPVARVKRNATRGKRSRNNLVLLRSITGIRGAVSDYVCISYPGFRCAVSMLRDRRHAPSRLHHCELRAFWTLENQQITMVSLQSYVRLPFPGE